MKSSAHYYDPITGDCRFSVPMKSKPGQTRVTTIKDARENGWYVSPTTILKILEKPELKTWQYQRIIEASRTLPMKEGESDDDYADRIIIDAFAEVGDSADLGSSIHKAIELHFQGFPYNYQLKPYVDIVQRWADRNKVTFLAHESRILNHELGICGTTDGVIVMEGREGKAVADFKTRRTKPGKKIEPYKTEPMQIAAYSTPINAVYGVNLYLSSTEQGRWEEVYYDLPRLKEEYAAFSHAVALYRHLNNFPHKC